MGAKKTLDWLTPENIQFPEDVLILKQGIEQAEARLGHGYGGTADLEYYRDGTWERYDAWSDNSKPKAEDYQVWVCRGLARIVNNAITITERNKEGIEIRKKIEESGKRSVFKVIK